MGNDDSDRVGCLVHNDGDDVAVAVRDLEPGRVPVAWLDSGRRGEVVVTERVPLGHKVALVDMPEGHKVVEYMEQIGLTKCALKAGSHVHTHNLRSARWQRSA